MAFLSKTVCNTKPDLKLRKQVETQQNRQMAKSSEIQQK